MKEQTLYDVAIVGGGLAGLSLAIQMGRQGYKVILFEKETYPFHKVCGEYISMESWPFLQSLGLPLEEMNLPRISKLLVTAPGGTTFNAALPLGGFGISRYTLDAKLRDIAVENNVEIRENCKVSNVVFSNETFTVISSSGTVQSKVCCGCYGKKSNLDVKWKRSFTITQSRKLNQFTGIKYHIETDAPTDVITLHNFKNGYCGMSKIEGNRYCLCYLTHTDNLKKSGQSIEKMEETILSANPHLKTLLQTSKKLYATPVSISQISFLQKTQVENHVLLLGDAAGLITPLCGNGMSIALHASKIVSAIITLFLENKTSRAELEITYTTQWKKQFGARMRVGRWIQFFFGKDAVTNLFVKAMKGMPAFSRWIIKQTHGEAF